MASRSSQHVGWTVATSSIVQYIEGSAALAKTCLLGMVVLFALMVLACVSGCAWLLLTLFERVWSKAVRSKKKEVLE